MEPVISKVGQSPVMRTSTQLRPWESSFLEEEGFLLDNSRLVFQSTFLFQPQNQGSGEKSRDPLFRMVLPRGPTSLRP